MLKLEVIHKRGIDFTHEGLMMVLENSLEEEKKYITRVFSQGIRKGKHKRKMPTLVSG